MNINLIRAFALMQFSVVVVAAVAAYAAVTSLRSQNEITMQWIGL